MSTSTASPPDRSHSSSNGDAAKRVDALAASSEQYWNAIQERLATATGALANIHEQLTILTQRVESVEGRVAGGSNGDTAAALERNTQAIEQLASYQHDDHENENGTFASLLDKADENLHHLQRLREIIATLPEVATAQSETIQTLSQQVESTGTRTESLLQGVAVVQDELGGMREDLGALVHAVQRCEQADANLAARQEQLVQSFKGLLERTTDFVQIAKKQGESVAAIGESLRGITETVNVELRSTREQLKTEVDRLSGGHRWATIFSILAFLAAGAAAVGVFMK